MDIQMIIESMNVQMIREWRRKRLRMANGQWRGDAIQLVVNRMELCKPVLWLNVVDGNPERARELAECYVELLRIAGGILNDCPNFEKSQLLAHNIRDDAVGFQAEYNKISEKDLRILHRDLAGIVGLCLQLANDTFVRMSKIRSLGGF